MAFNLDGLNLATNAMGMLAALGLGQMAADGLDFTIVSSSMDVEFKQVMKPKATILPLLIWGGFNGGLALPKIEIPVWVKTDKSSDQIMGEYLSS